MIKTRGKKSVIAILISIITFFVLVITNSIEVHAKDYDVNQIIFDIDIKDNGDVNIKETWLVDYSGEYSRFYKEFNTKRVKNIEEFNIDFDNVYINGEKAKQIKSKPSDNKRVDNTYYIENTSLGKQINMYYNVRYDEVVYEITYELEDVVKEIDGGDAIFCYRLVGDNFEESIGNIIINIAGAGLGNKLDVRQLTNDGEFSTDRNSDGSFTIYLYGHDANEMLKLNIALDERDFEGLQVVSPKDLEDSLRKDNLHKNVNPDLIVTAIMFSMIGIVLFILSADNRKYKKIIRKNPGYINYCFEQIYRTPYLLLFRHAFISKALRLTPLTMKELLYSLKAKGQVTVKGEELIIAYNYKTWLDSTEANIVSNIFNLIGNITDVDGYHLDMNNLKHLLLNDKAYYNLYSSVNKEFTNLYNLYNSRLHGNSELKGAVKFLNWYIPKYKLYQGNMDSTYGNLNKNLSLADALIALYVPSRTLSSDKTAIDREKTRIYNSYDTMDIMNTIFDTNMTYSNSGSSCASCSSCSSCRSCSGCGGGGAD